MKIGEAFPSKFLKAADIPRGVRPRVRIREVLMEEMTNDGKQEQKLVVYFDGKEKGLMLNKTNALTIAEIAGTEETDEWPGTIVILYVTKVTYQGKPSDAIRVDWPPPSAQPEPRRPAPAIKDEEFPDDSEAPF